MKPAPGRTMVLALWTLVVVFVIAEVFLRSLPTGVRSAVIVGLEVAFVLTHGAARYGWRGILLFVAMCLVVSNIFENVSISTGFPFGHYYYTPGLGPKIFQVPILVGLAYVGTGYLSWALGVILIGDVRRGSDWLTTIGASVIAAFAMVAWDVCLDPTWSTIDKLWIWLNGGGFFGVPLTNYLGWYLTVFVFYIMFAIYLRYRGAASAEVPALGNWYDAQSVIMYVVLASNFIQTYISGSNAPVMDATGQIWLTGNIYETAAILSIYTMLFISVLAAFRIAQRPASAPLR